MNALGKHRLLVIGFLGLALLLGWFAYAPAQGGDFILDDMQNLGGLSNVENLTSALQFIFSGSAGPIGRPIALASFVPQASAIETGAGPFLKINILLHLFNACLVASLFFLLTRARRGDEREALFVMLAATAIWLFMPLLASTSLMTVQRMTSLSATFVLLGLCGYLLARRGLDDGLRQSLIGMSAALVVGTVLAALSKENGVLLPMFALVLEMTILTRPAAAGRAVWRAWALVFLVLPTTLLVAYLAFQLPYDEAMTLRHGFSGWERLLTESRILWEYLYNAFVPRPEAFGPFHDGYTIARTLANPVTFLAFFGWLAMAAVAILGRRRFPLFAFAVLWYLGGHLLESTTLPLELYFEHRNYLPVIGPVYALGTLALKAPTSIRSAAYTGLVLYILANAFVLYGQATLWGNPPLAAHQWQQRFPDSLRATLRAIAYLPPERQERESLRKLQQFAEDHPSEAFVRILELDYSCLTDPQGDHDELVVSLESKLKSVDFTYNTLTMLSDLYSTIHGTQCNGVDSDTVRLLAGSLLQNPRYEKDGRHMQLHNQLMARIARDEGSFEKAVSYLEKSQEHRRTARINMMMVTTLADARKFDTARTYIENARQNPPWHPFRRFVWLSQLDGLERYVDDYEGIALAE